MKYVLITLANYKKALMKISKGRGRGGAGGEEEKILELSSAHSQFPTEEVEACIQALVVAM